MLKTLSEPCLLLLLFLSTIAALEHQWVSWDNEPLLDELPVLHTAFVQTGEELHYFSESTRFEAEMFVGHRVHQDTNMKTRYNREKIEIFKFINGLTFFYISLYISVVKIENITFEKSLERIYYQSSSTHHLLNLAISYAVGVPSQRRIFVRSRLNKPIVLDSIMGGTEISSLGTTFFDVVFLPREEGKVSAALHIHTSVGIFVYEISGLSTSNPYRIVPFVGTILPFNGTVYKDITIHNPHSSTFRINEILSSGGNAHVEMSHDIDEKMASEPLQYWDIRPFQTRTVGRILIIGHTLENITNFIRVGGLLLDDEGKGIIPHSLVLPIPLEITKRRGVFTTSDILDFGLLRQGERSQPQMFSVYQFQLNGKLEFEIEL
uniref:TMEM131 n=1 Tax=Heterorhabditis bacteriophora TaxID=37862 RepID=A0A1I7XHP5_HETBA